ncbi:DUF3889 domain-containing protein [Cohnella sp. WQ 127256]|uniref:DUF3889 domain-containing protein n=1 Tax=Cohnella sp. WQ 127256 TaxID=2938790 RepID=UPI00211959EA|nr:DUF3889 domain-containing protein [Cohnella sp. WQ 127256]
MIIALRSLLLVIGLSVTIILSSQVLTPIANAFSIQPEYAKWGELAMVQTKAKYQADIVDYLHVGRTQVSEGIAEETFKLWLKDSKHEFGVRISIRFHTTNDQIISIKFLETN